MKKVLRLVLMISIISLTLSISACSNSYNEMIDGFNKKYFKKGYLPPEPYTTSSKDFKEGEMLKDIIVMADEQLYLFTAPDGGEDCTYEWQGFAPVKDSDGKEKMKPIKIEDNNKKTLSFLAPGGFNRDKENLLVVTVTEKSGRQFTDTAKVFIEIEEKN